MKNNASFVYSFCLVIGDFLALVAAFIGAYLLRVTFDPRPVTQPVTALNYLQLFLFMVSTSGFSVQTPFFAGE